MGILEQHNLARSECLPLCKGRLQGFWNVHCTPEMNCHNPSTSSVECLTKLNIESDCLRWPWIGTRLNLRQTTKLDRHLLGGVRLQPDLWGHFLFHPDRSEGFRRRRRDFRCWPVPDLPGSAQRSERLIIRRWSGRRRRRTCSRSSRSRPSWSSSGDENNFFIVKF